MIEREIFLLQHKDLSGLWPFEMTADRDLIVISNEREKSGSLRCKISPASPFETTYLLPFRPEGEIFVFKRQDLTCFAVRDDRLK